MLLQPVVKRPIRGTPLIAKSYPVGMRGNKIMVQKNRVALVKAKDLKGGQIGPRV